MEFNKRDSNTNDNVINQFWLAYMISKVYHTELHVALAGEYIK